MSFIRPEIRDLLTRWREVIIGELICLLGLYWAIFAGGLLTYLGYLLIVVGLAMALLGVQRVRFRSGSGGPGLVQVDEGQISYFGPLDGGSVALADLERLALDASGKPAHWVLDQPGQPPLHVPVNAAGAEALFDAFATLPGIRTERMLAEMRRTKAQAVVIWERTALRPAHLRLH